MMKFSPHGRTRSVRYVTLAGCWLASMALLACAAHPAGGGTPTGKLTPQMRSGSAELRAYQIQDWIAPDDRTLVVNAVDHSLFKARFKGRCKDVRLVDTVAFVVLDSAQFDRYAGVVLPDGTRCEFASVTRVNTGTTSADQ